MSDRLYFEELTVERVLSIYERERPIGAVLCVGGQIPNDLALELDKKGSTSWGRARTRSRGPRTGRGSRFLLDRIGIPQPAWGQLQVRLKQAREFCDKVGIPGDREAVARPERLGDEGDLGEQGSWRASSPRRPRSTPTTP